MARDAAGRARIAVAEIASKSNVQRSVRGSS
jgi:hypothetical protein